jgi:hypothetical protein
MIKVQPKPFVSPTGKTINIVGINAKFINEFPVTVSPITSFQFYIEFVTETGERRDVINASSDEFYTFLVSQGIPEEEVKVTLDQTFAALLAGTKEQKYQAISGLVSFYGYTMLPIEEQEGQSPIVEVPEEPVVEPVVTDPIVETPIVEPIIDPVIEPITEEPIVVPVEEPVIEPAVING